MTSVSQLRKVTNKIKRIKTISQSLEGAKKEFENEFKKLADEFERASRELDEYIDMLRKRE